jgi:hypothetical protein
MKPEIRDTAIREIGCIIAMRLGLGYVPCEKHHLLTTGLHGNGKRRGENFTVGFNPWAHRGEPFGQWTKERCLETFGPSYAKAPRAFRELHGSDEELLAYQNERIREWASTVVGRSYGV